MQTANREPQSGINWWCLKPESTHSPSVLCRDKPYCNILGENRCKNPESNPESESILSPVKNTHSSVTPQTIVQYVTVLRNLVLLCVMDGHGEDGDKRDERQHMGRVVTSTRCQLMNDG